MAGRPGSDDDDNAPVLPGVTVPPWLHSGPVADSSVAPPKPPARSAAGPAQAEADRAGAGEREEQSPPNRITIGAQARAATGGGQPARGEMVPDGPSADRQDAAAGEGAGERVVDELSTLQLRAAAPASGRAAAGAPRPAPAPATRSADGVKVPAPPPPADAPSASAPAPAPATAVLDRRPARIVLLAAAGVAILGGSAVLGFVVTRGATGGAAEAAAGPTPGCAELAEDGRVVGSGPGSLDSPSGAVLAFDHAYYVERSAEKAFEAVAPTSRITEEQLRTEGIDRLAEGTTHCLELRELAPTLLEVDLTEFPPGADPVLIRQRVRVAEDPDGTWGIVSITPAG
ncbi:hypothetical protein [Dietzia aurantiaca]|uniref:DUF8176 domain-containing protein n=1 Tax=Dietzia aurantiaca TaxID=983873 RepID=A0ABV9PNK6_9ACTN